MPPTSSSPAASERDPVQAILDRIALPNEEDDFRAALINLGVRRRSATSTELAIGLIATLMGKANIARAAIVEMTLALAAFTEDELTNVTVVILDGAFIFIPGKPDGQFYKLPDMTPLKPGQVGVGLMTTVFHLGTALQLCHSVVDKP